MLQELHGTNEMMNVAMPKRSGRGLSSPWLCPTDVRGRKLPGRVECSGLAADWKVRAPAQKGFTLIEMIGVLVVIAILAAMLIPVMIRRVDRAAWVKESAMLTDVSDALVRRIAKTAVIPDESGWVQA